MEPIQGALSQESKMLDPSVMALLQAAFTGLQASGPSKTPTSLGQIIGQAGQAGMDTYTKGIANQRQLDQLAQQKLLQAAQIRRAQADAAKDEQATAAEKQERDFFASEPIRRLLSEGKIDEVMAKHPRLTMQNLIALQEAKRKGNVIHPIGAGGAIDAQGNRIEPSARPVPPTMPGTLRTRIDGDQSIQEEYRDGAWTQVGKGPRFAKSVAPIVNVGSGNGRAPANYRFKQNGELEPIPGGPADPKSKATRPMSATAQRELIETDEAYQGGQQALTYLARAKEINNKAMGFRGAGMVSAVGTLLPESIRPSSVDATEELDNVLTSSALPQLKAIFGGMPTEGERKVLLEVQGSSNKSPSVREKIFERAEAAVKTRIAFMKQKADRLRAGTYFNSNTNADDSWSDL